MTHMNIKHEKIFKMYAIRFVEFEQKKTIDFIFFVQISNVVFVKKFVDKFSKIIVIINIQTNVQTTLKFFKRHDNLHLRHKFFNDQTTFAKYVNSFLKHQNFQVNF